MGSKLKLGQIIWDCARLIHQFEWVLYLKDETFAESCVCRDYGLSTRNNNSANHWWWDDIFCKLNKIYLANVSPLMAWSKLDRNRPVHIGDKYLIYHISHIGKYGSSFLYHSILLCSKIHQKSNLTVYFCDILIFLRVSACTGYMNYLWHMIHTTVTGVKVIATQPQCYFSWRYSTLKGTESSCCNHVASRLSKLLIALWQRPHSVHRIHTVWMFCRILMLQNWCY